jgi:phosphoenolpyruvate-protein phosphotransferase (PTS system enzyme I)
MQTLRGSSVSPGIARGRAFLYTAEIQQQERNIDDGQLVKSDQHDRVRVAINDVRRSLEIDACQISLALDPNSGDIFRAQSAMLEDGSVVSSIDLRLKDDGIDAECVVSEVFAALASRFRGSASSALRMRGDDIDVLSRRLLLSLRGVLGHRLKDLPEGTILVASHLFPSDTVFLSRLTTVAVIAEFAGPAAHAALLARELGIPCIGNIQHLMESIRGGDDVIVDGTQGIAFVAPDADTSQFYLQGIADGEHSRQGSVCVERKPTFTRDRVEVAVLANAHSPEDVACAVRRGADGIGLFRTEPYYMASKHLPTEQEFSDFLVRCFEPLGNLRVNVRLLDIGADKTPRYLPLPTESDPFLGLRGARVLLRYPDLLECQLRAMLVNSKRLNLGILIPMVTLESDVIQIIETCRKLAASMGLDSMPPIGAMVETPAAALTVDRLAQHVDFLSIGSNDLTQYTMAAGRENSSVTEYFLDDHEAVIRLIAMSVADAGRVPVSLCGELAGRCAAIPVLLGAGLRSLSVAPSLLADVRRTVEGLAIVEPGVKQCAG